MMVQEFALEEGETCYYKDDASIDPDIALSYIGDKVQNILGHLQKEFEGGVSAENLGAKFGGYGSFLPMHQRSPSIWSQPKSPPRVQTPHFPKSPNVCSEKDESCSSPSMRASHTLKTSSDGASIIQKPTLSSGKVAEACRGKVGVPSSKSGNPCDHTTLKFRIKVGPERVAQYNAQISSLGLTSPSSSEGNSHDECDGLLPESHDKPNESPAYMLKMMTSFPVSDGLLLSPLCEDLLNLAKEREFSKKSECEAAPKTSGMSVKLLNNDVSRGKKTKFVDRSGNSEKSAENFIEDLSDLKSLGGDNMHCSMQQDLSCRSLLEVKDSDKHALVKKRKGSKGRVKGEEVSGDLIKNSSLEQTSDQSFGARISQRDVSVDHRQDSRNGGKGSHSLLKFYSEGEGATKFMNDSIVKGGQNSASSERNGFDPHNVRRLSFKDGTKSKGSQSSGKKASKAENSRDGDCAAPKTKLSVKKDVRRPNLSLKDVAHTTLEHTENPKRSLERPSGDMPKDFNLDDVKAKSAHADKLKERSSNNKRFANVPSDSHVMEPPATVVHSKEGIYSGSEQTAANELDDWVECERCKKWRLLPYGTKSDQLPENWVCSMQDWLPGMNRCDISEDATTAAINPSYLVPGPENQHSFAHANGTMAGGISSGAHGFNQNHLNHSSDHIKQQKMKEKQNLASMNYALPCNGKQQMQRLALKNASSRDVKLSLPGVNATKKSDVRHPNKSAMVSAKLNKRKGEHVIGDDANPKKKFKESGECVEGKAEMKRIKSKDALTVDNFQTSGGNLHMTTGQSVKSGLPIKAAMKNAKRKSAQKDGISGGPGIGQMYVKKHGDMQDLADSGMETCNGREVTTKKIRLKDYAYGQYQVETGHYSGSNLQDRKVSLDEDTKDGDFHRNKKARVSQVEEGFRRSQDDNISSKRKSAEAKVQSSGSKQYRRDRSVEKEQQVKQPIAKLHLTIEDLDKLRKDLGCGQLSTAATSSSSKVSDSRKNRPSYLEQRGSPEESVSSSPMRMLYPNQVSPMTMETAGKGNFRLDDVGAVGIGKKFQDMHESSELGTSRKRASGLAIDSGSEIFDSKSKLEKVTVDDNSLAPKHEVSGNMRHSLLCESNLKCSTNSVSVGKNNLRKSSDSKSEKPSAQRENDKKDQRSSHSCSKDVMQQNLKLDLPKSSIEQAQMEPWNGKVRLDLRQGDKQGTLVPSKYASGSSGSLKSTVDLRPDASVLGGTSKCLKGTGVACLQNGSEKYISSEAEQSLGPNASLGNKNVSGVTASTALKAAEDVLKEAEELRTHADLIKNSGFSSESNYEYFKAALKFLHGASLLEACNGEPNKQLETRPMQMYGAAAQLCKTCANEYEKSHELAAAALAYKCVEVAYMRVVYFKSSTTSRVWQDLQSSLQMVPQGESPSSSASDVDNLNNLAIADKGPLSKVSGSLAGNHIIVPRNRPNFVRLLDFTKDVNSAMEAAKKSQETLAAAQAELEKSNKDAMVSIKRAIDFSFQDIEELVRLVLIAFNTNHPGFRGNPE